MSTKKFVVGAKPRHGYPDNGKSLGVDMGAIENLYDSYKLDHEDADNDVTQLIVGQICGQVYNDAKTRLGAARDALSALKPKGVDDSQIILHMGPLKKNQRIMQKAVHYAVCDDIPSDRLQIDRVCDILRGTIELPHKYFVPDDIDVSKINTSDVGIGSKMIDAVNAVFDGSVVQAKNRYIETRYPAFMDWDGRAMSDELVAGIKEFAVNKLMGRDSFYRDLQLLIKIEKSKFGWDDTLDLSHIYLELQLVSSSLYGAKVTKSDSKESGHKKYQLIRSVMEHCEYYYFTNGGKITPLLHRAAEFYELPPAEYWQHFTEALGSMWDLYRGVQQQFVKTLQSAIDNSDWYKKNGGK